VVPDAEHDEVGRVLVGAGAEVGPVGRTVPGAVGEGTQPRVGAVLEVGGSRDEFGPQLGLGAEHPPDQVWARVVGYGVVGLDGAQIDDAPTGPLGSRGSSDWA
jgi:hypothetical protein